MKSIRSAQNLKGRHVLVRASLNEPVKNGVVQSHFRLRKMLPTITFLRDAGARTILVGHSSGDPAKKSLLPSAQYLQKHLPLVFVEDSFNDDGRMIISNMKNGDVVMLENLRRYSGEEANDESFGRRLAGLADVYVNENFSASHRAHASLIWPPKLLPSYIGLWFEEELKHFSQALDPPHPSLAIIAGAKPKTKVPLVYQLLETVDSVFVGGLSANEFLVAKGYKLGESLVSGEDLGVLPFIDHPKLHLPIDVYVKTLSGKIEVRELDDIGSEDLIVDVGPKTLDLLDREISKSAFLLWNGPVGDYEKGFRDGTNKVARMIASSEAHSLVGGGDTVTAIEPLHLGKELTFLSTAGGAMVDFLVDGTLPALEALKEGIQE